MGSRVIGCGVFCLGGWAGLAASFLASWFAPIGVLAEASSRGMLCCGPIRYAIRASLC